MAAAASLALVNEQETFTRSEIHAAMKQASQYYNKNTGSNLGAYIGGLVKAGKLNQVSNDKYALPAEQYERLRASLA